MTDMSIIKYLEESGLLKIVVSDTIENESKEQKRRFLGMLLGTLGATTLGSVLAGKVFVRASEGTIRSGEGTIRAGTGTIKAGLEFQCHLIIWLILKYKPKFNGVYLRNNLPKIKDPAYVINFDDWKSIGIHWIALHVNGDNIKYFDSFWFEYISDEIKNITTNIYKIQTNDSIMCGYFCIGFVDLLNYTNLFSPN